jgi:hypothetical protein
MHFQTLAVLAGRVIRVLQWIRRWIADGFTTPRLSRRCTRVRFSIGPNLLNFEVESQAMSHQTKTAPRRGALGSRPR